MTTPIRTALLPTSFLLPLTREGAQALKREHLALIEEEIRGCFADSLDLDKALEKDHEQENRWDYLLGHEETRKIFGLEPHTANNHEVSTVIKKRARAIEQLAGHLRPGARVADWFWVASGKVDFLPIEKAHNRLASNGIKFVGTRLLKKYLPVAPDDGNKKVTKKKKPRR